MVRYNGEVLDFELEDIVLVLGYVIIVKSFLCYFERLYSFYYNIF